MAAEATPRRPPAKGPSERTTDRIHDNLAALMPDGYEDDYPGALGLASRILARMARRLRGNVTRFRGSRKGTKMRAVMRGALHGRLIDVCQLATRDHAIPRAAVRDAVEELAAVLGLTVRASEAGTADAFLSILSRFAQELNDVIVLGLARAADGDLDPQDLEAIDEELRQAGQQLAALQACVTQMRIRGKKFVIGGRA